MNGSFRQKKRHQCMGYFTGPAEFTAQLRLELYPIVYTKTLCSANKMNLFKKTQA